MKTFKPLAIPLILLPMFAAGCYVAGSSQQIPEGINSYTDIRAYTFEPKTFFEALERGDEELFQPIPDWMGQPEVLLPGSVAWRQEDYLKLVNTLNQTTNQDTLEDWNVYWIRLSRDCADTPVGFDWFSITYFKAEGDQYVTRIVNVWSLRKEAAWAEGYDPRPFLFGWKSIDMKELKITADDALQIAEANGGQAFRQSVNNNCGISVRLMPNVEGKDWSVDYDGYFIVNVDPYSGTYRIVSRP